MTINDSIALVNAVMGLAFVALGGALLWQARRSLRQWPVSALVALAGPYVGAGVMLLHRMGWRLGDLPGDALDRNGVGTLVLQLVIAGIVLALGQRVARGRLLTDSDRRRVDAS